MDTECEACQARLAYALISRQASVPVTSSGGCMREAGELILCDKGMLRYNIELEIQIPYILCLLCIALKSCQSKKWLSFDQSLSLVNAWTVNSIFLLIYQNSYKWSRPIVSLNFISSSLLGRQSKLCRSKQDCVTGFNYNVLLWAESRLTEDKQLGFLLNLN